MKNRIKVERAEKAVTQQQLADAVGVSRQTIVAIEEVMEKPVESIFLLEEGD